MIKGETPFLAVVQKNDPWYNGKESKQSGDCGTYFDGRPGSKSVVLDGRKEHGVMTDQTVLADIVRFLNANQKAD